ncbi:hypothetical protein CMV_010013 [Castanea mollissima]|uniref:Uncharacterized protein n=1 Tax=Castanea mollissima TaxID=60419 RepID=A0A8J4RNJ4_9ROSI|nr:hypothetical protein CMV_010013 [Castanea mollissima]
MDSQSQNTSLQWLQNVEKAIPDEVWACGPSAIVLDLSNNFVQDVPAQVGCLRSIQVCNINGLDCKSFVIIDEPKVKENFLTLKSKEEDAFKRKDYLGAICWYTEAINADPLMLLPDRPKAYYREGVAYKLLKGSCWVCD